MSQKDFWQIKFCATRTLLIHFAIATTSVTLSPLKIWSYPFTGILHLTETRVFLKLLIARVLLQWMIAAKKAHQLGTREGTEQSWATRSWLVLWTGWKEQWRRQLSNWDVWFLFPDKQHIFQEHWKTAEWYSWKSKPLLNTESGWQT